MCPISACLGLVLLLVQAGCREQPEPKNPAILDSATARRSLDSALGAWRNGAGAGRVPGVTPPTHRIDSQSPTDRKLIRYEILGEVSGEGARWFATRLFFGGSDGPETVRFVVLGEDPRFVFREEDYLMMIHWDHDMSEDDDEPATADEPATRPETAEESAGKNEPSEEISKSEMAPGQAEKP